MIFRHGLIIVSLLESYITHPCTLIVLGVYLSYDSLLDVPEGEGTEIPPFSP